MGRKVTGTAPVRNKSITDEDFGKSLSPRLKYYFQAAWEDQTPVEKIKLWNRFIPVAPDKAFEILTRDLPDDTEIVLKLEDDGSGRIDVDSDEKFNEGRDFDIKKKTLKAGMIRVKDGYQGKGYGRFILRNEMEFFHALGIRKFKVTASLDNGGYTWARMGFLPVKDDDFKGTAREVRESIKALKPLLSDEEKQKLKNWGAFRRRTDMWKVADADIDLGPRLSRLFNKAAQGAEEEEPKKSVRKARELVDALKDHFSKAVFDYMKTQAEKNGSVMIGRVLLTGTSWDGEIDMDNVKQMERVGNYTGGWRYLEIK